jgi:hypothetical protein
MKLNKNIIKARVISQVLTFTGIITTVLLMTLVDSLTDEWWGKVAVGVALGLGFTTWRTLNDIGDRMVRESIFEKHDSIMLNCKPLPQEGKKVDPDPDKAEELDVALAKYIVHGEHKLLREYVDKYGYPVREDGDEIDLHQYIEKKNETDFEKIRNINTAMIQSVVHGEHDLLEKYIEKYVKKV